MITEEKLALPIIGRSVLESLQCDNHERLLAARDRYGDDIDVVNRLKQDVNKEECKEKIAALVGESVFHNGR